MYTCALYHLQCQNNILGKINLVSRIKKPKAAAQCVTSSVEKRIKSHPQKLFYGHTATLTQPPVLILTFGSLPLAIPKACFTRMQLSLVFAFLMRFLYLFTNTQWLCLLFTKTCHVTVYHSKPHAVLKLVRVWRVHTIGRTASLKLMADHCVGWRKHLNHFC